MLIDTHAHLYYDQFVPDFDQVIERAKDANLKAIINIGADIESSRKSLRQAQGKLAGIKFYASIGLHPHEVSKPLTAVSIHPDIAEMVGKLEEIYQSNTGKVVAVGECGLDYYSQGTDYSPPSIPQDQQIQLQKELFRAQANLAKKLNLPLIIHCREARFDRDFRRRRREERPRQRRARRAWEDIFIPELAGTTGVFHSFTGSEEEAKKALDLGYYLGFSCIVTYPKNDYLREIIKWMPLDKILTETDCPFLPPQTQRGQRNEPVNVIEVIKVIAEIKSLSQDETSQVVWQNATKLFKV